MENKVVIITGVGSGMELSAAKLFHTEGALLVLAEYFGKRAGYGVPAISSYFDLDPLASQTDF